MTEDHISMIIRAYTEWFGAPTSIVQFGVAVPPITNVAFVIYVPTEAEQADAEGNVTLLGTAGLSAAMIGRDFNAEVGIEVKGTLSDNVARDIGEALVDLGTAPLKTGRSFEKNQILRNLNLPMFSRFQLAILLDWDPIDGFVFPSMHEQILLLRVVPLFETEARFIESSQNRAEAYLRLYNRGLRPEEPNREPVV